MVEPEAYLRGNDFRYFKSTCVMNYGEASRGCALRSLKLERLDFRRLLSESDSRSRLLWGKRASFPYPLLHNTLSFIITTCLEIGVTCTFLFFSSLSLFSLLWFEYYIKCIHFCFNFFHESVKRSSVSPTRVSKSLENLTDVLILRIGLLQVQRRWKPTPLKSSRPTKLVNKLNSNYKQSTSQSLIQSIQHNFNPISFL